MVNLRVKTTLVLLRNQVSTIKKGERTHGGFILLINTANIKKIVIIVLKLKVQIYCVLLNLTNFYKVISVTAYKFYVIRAHTFVVFRSLFLSQKNISPIINPTQLTLTTVH